MEINFYATLRPIAGSKSVDFSLVDGATVMDLVTAVVERFPAMKRELLDDQGKLYGHVHVFVNGRDAPYLGHTTETVLQTTDRVDIFPAVGGGSANG